MASRKAFWSYAHQDNADDGGRITELARQLSQRYRLLTGTTLQMFLDVDVLVWGDAWRHRIEEALLSTSFFIPVLTPTYFQREQCRYELMRFSQAAKSLGLQELILPIYYVTIPELSAEARGNDSLIALVREHQWYDWRDIGFEDPTSSLFRRGIQRLTEEIIRREKGADAKPVSSPLDCTSLGDPVGGTAAQFPSESDQLLIDIDGALLGTARAATELDDALQETLAAIRQSDTDGRGLFGRLAVVRNRLPALETLTGQLRTACAALVDVTITADGLDLVQKVTAADGVPSTRRSELRRRIEELVDHGRMIAAAVAHVTSALEGVGTSLKEIRPLLAEVLESSREINDAVAVMTRWH